MAMQNVTHIVLHYSATFEDQDIGAREITAWHRARNPPFRTIGYHEVVRLDGTREAGRPWHEVGAHVGGQNSGKLGICYVGGLKRATGPNVGHNTMTPAQEATVIKIIREMLARWPNAQVVGHFDLAPTQCPGFSVPAWWSRVNQAPIVNDTVIPATLPTRTPNVTEDDYHIVERGETWWSISREHGITLDDLFALNGVTGTDPLPVGKRVRLSPVTQSLTTDDPQPSGNSGWFTRFIRWITGG